MRGNNGVIAIIPARGGSKGVPRKNIHNLAGKPLIAYTIEAALRSKNIHRVIVSTDDEEIAGTAKTCGAEVPFIRPKELAKDDTPTYLAIQHAVKYLEDVEGYKVKIVAVLQPTSPLRGEEYIDKAVEKLIKTGADSVITVCKVKQHPSWTFTAKGDRLSPLLANGLSFGRRQDLSNIYWVNGAVYAVRRNVLFEQNSVFGRVIRAVIMPYKESLDIDEYLDFFIVEMVLKYWKEWLNEKSKDRE